MTRGKFGLPRPFAQPGDYTVVFPNEQVIDGSGKIVGVSHMHVKRAEQTPSGDVEITIEPSKDGGLLLVAVESTIDIIEEQYGKRLNLSRAEVYC